jgi:hypothetical protein
VRAARDRVDTLTAAIREVEKTIADLEAENVRLADEKQRAATVAEIETIGRDLKKAAADFDFASGRLASVAERMAACMPDAVGLSLFAVAAKSEVPPTVMLLQSVLKDLASQVIAGTARATLLTPPDPAAPPLPKPELVKVALGIGGI